MIDHTVHCLTTGNVSVVKHATDPGRAACLMAQHIEERDGYVYDVSSGPRFIVVTAETSPWKIIARHEVSIAKRIGALHEFSVGIVTQLEVPS